MVNSSLQRRLHLISKTRRNHHRSYFRKKPRSRFFDERNEWHTIRFFFGKDNSSSLQLIFYFLNLIWNFANFFSAIYRGSAACAAIFFFDYFLFTLHTEREREDVCFDHSWMGVRCTCACVCVLCACCNAVCYVIASNFHNFTVTFFLPSILLTRSQRSVNHSRMLLLFFVSKSLIRNEI